VELPPVNVEVNVTLLPMLKELPEIVSDVEVVDGVRVEAMWLPHPVRADRAKAARVAPARSTREVDFLVRMVLIFIKLPLA
jgi:hypothetical protein